MNKLCCILSPTYDCQACGFQECNACFNDRCKFNSGRPSHLRTFHIVDDAEGDDCCRDTLIKLVGVQKDHRQLGEYTTWAIKSKVKKGSK
jgi:hypothetical protein